MTNEIKCGNWKNKLADLIDKEADECTTTYEPNCHAQDIIDFVKKEIEYAELRSRENLLIKILAKAESMNTAREVRHLIKEYILSENPPS